MLGSTSATLNGPPNRERTSLALLHRMKADKKNTRVGEPRFVNWTGLGCFQTSPSTPPAAQPITVHVPDEEIFAVSVCV